MGWGIIGLGGQGTGQDTPWIPPRFFRLEDERIIRFTLEAVEGSKPIANRRRKIGQSGAVPTAVEAEPADSTAGEGWNVPKNPTRAR